MKHNVKSHTGTIKDMGKRFIDAWHRHERGEDVDENNITFLNMEDMVSALSSRRLSRLNSKGNRDAYAQHSTNH